LFKAAGVKKVIWYCGESRLGLGGEVVVLTVAGSSKGRGTRAAGWFGDHVDKRRDVEMESMILEGGVKGWAKAGGKFVEMMEEYDEAVWEKFE
jgi:arsenical-resistance protein 2